jgi:putative tryptophan/tyrosine transport system substrate-binding protein
MRRREFITLVGGAVAAPLAVRAQQRSEKTARIGLLTRKTDASVSAQIDAFRQGLADLGWVEGRNIRIEHRDAEGQAERLLALAVELVGLNVDVIVTVDTPPTQAAKQARSPPIRWVPD